LIIPYIVFGVFSWLVYDAIFGKWGGDLGIQMLRLLIATDEFRCNSVLWFLPAMFIVLLVAFVVDRLFKPSIKILCAIVIVDYIVTTCLLRRFVPWSIGERKNVLDK